MDSVGLGKKDVDIEWWERAYLSNSSQENIKHTRYFNK